MSDLISRQAAIDAIDGGVSFMHIEADKLGMHESASGDWFKAEEVLDVLKQLPSVQPDLKGVRCEIICSQRQTGRTTKLIEKCARYKYALIVCPSRLRANMLFHDAQKMGKNIPLPITFEDFIQGRFSTEHINAFLIDDLDQCLAFYSRNVPIDTVVFERRAEE